MRICLKLKREEKKTHTHMYKFVHELSKKNILFQIVDMVT